MANSDRPLTLEQTLQLGVDHFQAGRLAQAEAVFRPLLAEDEPHPIVLGLMGCIAHQAGKHQQALEYFNKALQRNPNDPYLRFNLGIALVEQGRLEEALAHFRKAIVLNPNYAMAHNSLGVVLQHLGKIEEAVASYRQAIALAADFAEAHNNLGVALQALGKANEAETYYRKALAINPHYVEAHNNLGNLFQEQNRLDEALAGYRQALQLDPSYAKAYNNLGVVMQKRGETDEAQRHYRQALQLDPDYAEALNNLGSVFQEQGKTDEALHHFRRALQLDSSFAKAQWNLSLLLLLLGDLAEGLTLYEKRFEGTDISEAVKARANLAKLATIPRWQGEDLQGKTLLIWTEQGLGDSLMMLRYLPLLKDKGAGDILVACQPALTRIMQTLPAVGQVIGNGAPLPLNDCDYHCPMMSLPYLFGTRLDTIPKAVPYISVPPAMTEKWARRLAPFDGLKVGLVWTGSKTQKKDSLRSIPFQALAPLLALPGVRFVSLQKDGAENHAALLDWMAECEDFLDTAALVQQLDLVISVDTAVAHLAGALARPVWLLNRFESEWRWLLEREDSPWYPTMRIFRQPVLHDWGSVIQRVARELAALPRA